MTQELDITSRPLAAEGYESYRCKGGYGWIMIGANSDDEALSEARRSIANPTLADIDRWDGAAYVPCQGAERNAAMEAQMSRSRSLLAKKGFTIQQGALGACWALLPGHTEFYDDGEGAQNYYGFFSSEAELLEEMSELLGQTSAILVQGPEGNRWLSHPELVLASRRPEFAQRFCLDEAIALVADLASRGHENLCVADFPLEHEAHGTRHAAREEHERERG